VLFTFVDDTEQWGHRRFRGKHAAQAVAAPGTPAQPAP